MFWPIVLLGWRLLSVYQYGDDIVNLTEMEFDKARPIDSYGPGYFRVGGKIIEGNIWVTSTEAGSWGGYNDSAPLLALAEEIDVLFVGTGVEIAHIPKDLRVTLEAAGIGVEVMNSPSACRTFNVLLSEGRRIAVALLTV